MQILVVEKTDQIKHARQVAEKAFSQGPDSSLDEWFSFKEMSQAISSDRGICLLAIEKGEALGMIYAQPESPINGKEGLEKWVISIIAVIPSSTGKGIGSELLRVLEVKVKEKNVQKMFVYTNKGDDRVVNFYYKNGYEDAGRIKDYQYGENNSAVFLLKYLSREDSWPETKLGKSSNNTSKTKI